MAINFLHASLVCGVAVTTAVCQPASLLGHVGSVALGAIASGVLYGMGNFLSHEYHKWAHRVAEPLLLDDQSPEFKEALDWAIDEVKKHPSYTLLKTRTPLNTDEKAESYFRKGLPGGYCAGSAANILKAMAENPGMDSQQLVASIEMKKVFYDQLCQEMVSVFQGEERSLLTALAHSWDSDSAADIARYRLGADYYHGLAKAIRKGMFSWDEVQGPTFPARCPAHIYSEKLGCLTNSTALGRIEVKEKTTTPFSSTIGHTFAFEYTPDLYRIYDPISAARGGLFEYTDKHAFFEALQNRSDMRMEHPQVTLFLKPH